MLYVLIVNYIWRFLLSSRTESGGKRVSRELAIQISEEAQEESFSCNWTVLVRSELRGLYMKMFDNTHGLTLSEPEIIN